MNNTIDVAIIGAGPYGLSVAAHLRAAGVNFRQFGEVMQAWRTAMPAGMFLKSQGFASNLSDPKGTHTLKAFCGQTGLPYADYGLPVPLDTFVAYGQWFQEAFSPDVEEVRVAKLAKCNGHYELGLTDGRAAHARNVVVATGIEHFAHMPRELAELPKSVCTHSCEHSDLEVFRGRRVIVVGAGQSALESAALLHESGADVRMVMRESRVVWNGPPLAPDRPLAQRMREPEAGLGSGWATWFYSNHPKLFRRLPVRTRVFRARTALGPAGAAWLRERVEGAFPILVGHSLESAWVDAGEVRLRTVTGDGDRHELSTDHIIAATGYRPDVGRLGFLDDRLRGGLRTIAGSPAVDRHYETSTPGMYVIGPGVASTFGPVMRFVYGADPAARAVAAGLGAGR